MDRESSGPGSVAAWLGAGGVALFVAATLLMHLLRPELNPATDAVSFYMNGRWGWIQGGGLVALGIGSIALAGGIYRRGSFGGTPVGTALLALWGAAAVVGGLFPPDPIGSWDQPASLSGTMHNSAAMVAFLALPAGALLLSRRGAWEEARPGRDRQLRWLAIASAASLAAFFACLLPAFNGGPPFLLGLAERVLLGLYVAWLLTASRALVRMPTAALR